MKLILRILKYFSYILTVLLIALVSFFYIPISTAYLATTLGSQADFYFENEEQWIKNHTIVAYIYHKAWEFKARKTIVDNVHERFENQAKKSVIDFAVHEVQQASMTQYQQDIPVVSGSSFSCLVRGFGFCDQVNAGLVLLLQDELTQVHLYNIYDVTNTNCHTLVKSQSTLGTVWIDAYGCQNKYGFSDELTPEGKKLLIQL